VVSGVLNGDLARIGLQSPWAGKPVSVAIGAEYREDAIRLAQSANILNGDLTGLGGTAGANGATNVKEAFVEALVPIAGDRRFVHALDLGLAYRRSDYNLAGGLDTYKVSLVYAPSRDLSFRGGYNRSARAPSVVELFAPQGLSTGSVTDSCAGTAPTATLAQCANTGVTAAQYRNIAACSSNFCTTLTGGSLALKPEESDTFTAGVVLTPRAVSRFTLSADWFHIKVTNLIGTVPIALSYSQCLNNADPFYCALIRRDASGSLATTSGYIVNTNINTGYLTTSGIDVASAYTLPLADIGLAYAGRLSFGFDGTWTHDRRISPVQGQAAYDCAGLYGPTCGVPMPKWRHNLRATLESAGGTLLSVNWRFIGRSAVDINTGGSVFNGVTGGRIDIADARIPAYTYIDLTGSQRVGDRFSLRAGVRNVFDRNPPIVDNINLGVNTSFGNGNTFPSVYDVLGRTVFIGLSAKM